MGPWLSSRKNLRRLSGSTSTATRMPAETKGADAIERVWKEKPEILYRPSHQAGAAGGTRSREPRHGADDGRGAHCHRRGGARHAESRCRLICKPHRASCFAAARYAATWLRGAAHCGFEPAPHHRLLLAGLEKITRVARPNGSLCSCLPDQPKALMVRCCSHRTLWPTPQANR